jgi:membrane-associated PAP2 superfamily phosphatase
MPDFLSRSPQLPLSDRSPVVSAQDFFRWTLFAGAMLLAWDALGLDIWLASFAGDSSGFPLKDHPFWNGVMHERVRQLHWLPEIALAIGIFFPFGSLRTLPRARRVQLVLGPLAAVLVVSYLKLHSRTSCPWDLEMFGGTARYVSHWMAAADGGSGGCFPAGHASAGFAYVSGFFAFRHVLPATARRWLVGSLLAGLALGIAQQLRGAHFMSHTLWTAWLCWTTALAADALVTRLISRTRSRAQEPAHGSAAQAP